MVIDVIIAPPNQIAYNAADRARFGGSSHGTLTVTYTTPVASLQDGAVCMLTLLTGGAQENDELPRYIATNPVLKNALRFYLIAQRYVFIIRCYFYWARQNKHL